MICPPPKEIDLTPFNTISELYPAKIDNYLKLFSPIDSKGRYLHYDALRYKVPEGLDKDLVWAIIKFARKVQLQRIIDLGQPAEACHFFLTPTIQKAISEVDRNTTTASLEWMCSKIGEECHVQYLLNDLIEDEAISSSQLEGAATTIKAAKDLIKRKRKPRTPDEKMIIGNLKMMRFAWENKDKDLSTELISEMHRVGVEAINDEKYRPGSFRDSDDVEVADAEGNTIYIPPVSKGLKKRLKKLVEWVNSIHHNVDNNEYIHPIVKAVIIHFAIGYEHPFRDGNGRVARSLFYWYMFKNGFAAFRYISISVLLKSAPSKYVKSYLYSETDSMDLTYFIEYQCSIVMRALAQFKNAYMTALKDIEDFNKWLWESDLFRKLNDKQRTVFQVAKSGVASTFTATNVKENLSCSYNTASSVLNGLVDLKLFKKEKVGREWVYKMLSKDKIVSNWR